MSLEEAVKQNTEAMIELTKVILQNGNASTVAERPARTRRTKAELAADKAAKEAGKNAGTETPPGLDLGIETPAATEGPAVTLETLKAAGHALVGMGHNQEGLAKARELITKFGVKMIDDVKPEDYSTLCQKFIEEVKNWGKSEANTQL